MYEIWRARYDELATINFVKWISVLFTSSADPATIKRTRNNIMKNRNSWVLFLAIALPNLCSVHSFAPRQCPRNQRQALKCSGWVQRSDGEWEWKEDDPNFIDTATVTSTTIDTSSTATPQLPSGKLKPKQSLGQNFLKDPNTVAKIIRAFHQDVTRDGKPLETIIELGPGAGALTDRLMENYGSDILQCIEIDPRSVDILNDRYPDLVVHHEDVLQVNYPELAKQEGHPLVVIGNLPYYITSQILFALADASHYGAVQSATVTMQWEVAQRMVAPTRCKVSCLLCSKLVKLLARSPSHRVLPCLPPFCHTSQDYGILSVVFQTYAEVKNHFKIPPTVFYPQPKVDSALVGLHFLGPAKLRQRLAGVDPVDFRTVVTTAFQQRRKTIRNSLKKLDGIDKELLDAPPVPLPESVLELQAQGDEFALKQQLPTNWGSLRPEELTAGQFVEVTRLLFGNRQSEELGRKVWRKLKHGI